MPDPIEAYWRPKAEELIEEINFPLFYGIESEEVLELGDEYGYDRLTANLRTKQYMQQLYWDDRRDEASELWVNRDLDFDEALTYDWRKREWVPWFWWYHGAFS